MMNQEDITNDTKKQSEQATSLAHEIGTYQKTAQINTYNQNGYPTAQKKEAVRLNEFQQGKVTQYLKLVKWVVARIMDRLPKHIQSEDLSHSGILGLIDAVQRFVWGRDNEETEFKAYAECRIRGQIMDELRQQDLLPRSAREKINNFKKAVDELRRIHNDEPNEQQICDHMQIDLDTCFRLKAESQGGMQVSLSHFDNNIDVLEGILRKTLDMVNIGTPEGMVHVKEVKGTLSGEIDKLSLREKQVISLYYLEEMTLKEIGAILSITESRVSQIHAQALSRLMVRLKKVFDLSDTIIPEGI